MVNFDELSNRVIGLTLEVHKQGQDLINFNTKLLKTGIKRLYYKGTSINYNFDVLRLRSAQVPLWLHCW